MVVLFIFLLATLVVVAYRLANRKPNTREVPVAAKPFLAPDADIPPLPQRYGTDEIVAMVKNPHWLYTYWELTGAKQAEFEACYGRDTWEASTPTLRVYQMDPVSSQSSPYLDIPIAYGANNWYVQVGRPSTSFFIDLGRKMPDNTFVTLVRSNTVTTPSNHVSDLIDPNWPPLEGVWRSFGTVARLSGPETRAATTNATSPQGWAWNVSSDSLVKPPPEQEHSMPLGGTHR